MITIIPAKHQHATIVIWSMVVQAFNSNHCCAKVVVNVAELLLPILTVLTAFNCFVLFQLKFNEGSCVSRNVRAYAVQVM